MISKIYTLCYDNENGTYVGSHLSETPMTMFTQSKSLYYIGALCDATMYFRGMEDDFGILPLPKYNEKQEEYRTPLSGASLMLGVSTLPDKDALEFIGIITEAMAIKSHELLRSAVYETVFENQLTRDEESKKTMTLIVNGLYADFVFVHANAPEVGKLSPAYPIFFMPGSWPMIFGSADSAVVPPKWEFDAPIRTRSAATCIQSPPNSFAGLIRLILW